MKIRPEQIQAYEETSSPESAAYFVNHLREFAPLHAAVLGETGLLRLVEVGKERARAHRFTRRNTVGFYLEAMILLGAHFDTDPQYPEISRLLSDRSVTDQTMRADRVHEWLMKFLEAAGGPNRQYAKQALVRARSLRPIPLSGAGFRDDLVLVMKQVHPEKVTYLTEEVVGRLVPRAIEEAQRYRVLTELGVCLFAGMMFAVGHGFTEDPKYPWVAKTLTNPALTDPESRAQKLYSRTMTYLDHVIQHLGLS